ncbi:uncharacterized protein GGS22DRAFT_166881 [Annulohypoxylon maeteangense]|uniref:uncharacterized protein n=1 Tax=Annulohypoxylon maeteangense TaxID=1927788 RepID=UPI0020081D70|nr:uncharacterized protein GGS22DRAFT_166881 [Annulohypoxylon maeteangense]KAI0883404.1 hypothetical protein GGS22DRAFT_166881 [Annulohypoxylon maeteangense]
MSQTPVKVPPSAASYTPATQDSDLRSQINMLLLREGHIAKIQEHLLHSLNAHTSNWPSAVQTHALALLRSGDVTTFPALVQRVLKDVRHDTLALAAESSETNGTSNGKAGVNGTSNSNGNGASAGNGDTSSNNNNLAVPQAVVDAVLKLTRECLESVCEVDDGPAG